MKEFQLIVHVTIQIIAVPAVVCLQLRLEMKLDFGMFGAGLLCSCVWIMIILLLICVAAIGISDLYQFEIVDRCMFNVVCLVSFCVDFETKIIRKLAECNPHRIGSFTTTSTALQYFVQGKRFQYGTTVHVPLVQETNRK